MRYLVVALLAVSLHLSGAQGKKRICPLKGQQFPAPTSLSSEALFRDATSVIERAIRANLTAAPYNETTFSIGMFSTTDDGLLYEFHHTDPAVATSRIGANEVDADSVYRIASITKILTLYQWLIADGDQKFNSPISDFIPQLLQYAKDQDDYPAPSWDEITVNDLAMFLAGIGRDYGLNDVAIPGYITSLLPTMAAAVLPSNPENGISVPQSDDPVCGYFTSNITYVPCSRDVYIQKVANLASSFEPGYTPSYSNANFAVLGIALENMLGASIEDIFDKTVAKPLGLRSTTMGNPLHITNDSVIPGGGLTRSGWDDALGPLNHAAGGFSTTNELGVIGRSILNSTLMARATTRRWFSTTTFVDTIDQAVGRGWEVFRVRANGHSVDLFTKSGNWGVYNSVLFLLPAYDFGFSILSASSAVGGALVSDLPNVIVNTLLPPLERIAERQASARFAGRYISDTTNTSITVTADGPKGLRVTEYVVGGGVDLLGSVFALFGADVDFRLVPNQLFGGGDGARRRRRVGFSAVYQPPTAIPPRDEFYWPCESWLDVDDFTYASVPLGLMAFDVDADGNATSVRPVALRETLLRR
ncbi:putative beta-lactamase transpeptidase-like protein [Rosellinia necatrix]|uniref:Putative beta-lactamase transpeptidase-like protein n=1 Tax=Rosellinia necatrix TaxID=77044 RepID=A0A1W2THC8_ROSNE|nr:putative beta-lactamase transpeptidase-like protein [Rosellinia necatrix]